MLKFHIKKNFLRPFSPSLLKVSKAWGKRMNTTHTTMERIIRLTALKQDRRVIKI